jgi:hypothetical protein
MQRMKELIIAVSQHTVFLAESAIMGCIACTKSACIPLTRVLDSLSHHPPGRVEYILPVLAACPKCHASLDELALVAPKAAVVGQETRRV